MKQVNWGTKKYPRTLNEAFGPNCRWKSDYETMRDKKESPWWWIIGIILFIFLIILTLSQS